MPLQAGDFTASQLAVTQVTADRMWADDMMRADFTANVEVWKALKAEQNARVSILEDSEKDREVKVHWINSCNDQAQDCDTDDCDLAGDELGSDSKSYSLDMCKKWNFTVDEMKFRTNDYSMEQVVAKGFLKADKILSEEIAQTAVAKLEAFKGVNLVTDGIGTVNNTTTETDVAAADWNERLFAHMIRIGIQNQLSNPFLLSGSNMYEDWLVVQAARANANGKGASNLYNMIRMYFDLFNVDTVNAPKLKTYMINRGSVAFASKAYYGATPTVYKSQDRYSIPSRNLPGVRFDVHYTNRCVGKTMKHDFSVKAYFDYFLNPTGCDAGRTGILAFNRT